VDLDPYSFMAFAVVAAVATLSFRAPLASQGRAAVRPLLQAPDPPEQTPEPLVPSDDGSEDVDLSLEFAAGKAYGEEMRARFLAPRIDDPGLPYADSLVCIGGALFIAQWALSPAVPPGIKIPPPSWLAPMALPAGIDWRGIPYILPALGHGAGLALCWVLGALAAAAFEAEAYTGTWQTALSRTWRAGAFAIGVLIFSTQLSLYVSLSSQGLDPYTVPTTSGIDSAAPADMEILSTAFELIVDCAVQGVYLTLFRLYRWADAQGPPPSGKGRGGSLDRIAASVRRLLP